jgi:hypothetical protein
MPKEAAKNSVFFTYSIWADGSIIARLPEPTGY